MATLIDVPEFYVQSYFGDVRGIIWFEVTPNNGPFSMRFRVYRASAQVQNIQVTNPNNSAAIVWQKEYEASSNPNPVIDLVTIWHNPQVNSDVYSIQNI